MTPPTRIDTDFRDGMILMLLYDTNLRQGEISQVNHEMLDIDEKELRIPAEIQKDYLKNNSPWPARFALDQSEQLRTERTLRAYLNAHEGESTALLLSRKTNLTGKVINNVVKRAAERAEIEPYAYGGRGSAVDVSAHALRYSVPQRMLRVNESTSCTMFGAVLHTRPS